MPHIHANLTMMFLELDFFDRFKAAADAGFEAVEVLFPYPYNIDEIAAVLKQNKLGLKLINMPPGDWDAGERGIAALPDRQEEYKRAADLAIKYAHALDCKVIHCMSGIIADGMNKAQCTQIYIDNLIYAAKIAKPLGIDILVEAINPVNIPNFLVNTQEQSYDIVRQTGMDNVKMQFDIYHCQMAQGSVATRLSQYLPYIGHVQIADVPGRHEPGTGEINFPFLFKHLDEIGYKGWVGCEYSPKGNTIDGLTWWHEWRADD